MRAVVQTNAGNLAARMRHRSKLYPQQITEAQRQNADELLAKAKQFSNRRHYSLEQLRQMGHPYAKRNPRPPVAAHIINKQSGAVYAGWHRQVRRNSDGATATVYNTAPHSGYLLSGPKSKMIRRPIMEEALRRTQAQRERNLRNARRRGLRARTGR